MPPKPNRSSGRVQQVALLVLLLFLGAAMVLVWNMWTQVVDLEERLRQTEREREYLQQETAELRRRAMETQEVAQTAQQRAAQAELESKRLEKARKRAELERELARESAERYQEESEEALRRAEQARLEAERIRKQRERELDHMQEALSHIVDTRRTPVGMVMNLGEDSFLFDFDKATLRPENREILSRIAGVLLASHGYRIYVYGHTDDVGEAGYNRRLSERRAQAVRDYLVQAGLPEDLVEAKGFGEESPKVAGKSEAARQKNRRVEIGVVDTVIHFPGSENN